MYHDYAPASVSSSSGHVSVCSAPDPTPMVPVGLERIEKGIAAARELVTKFVDSVSPVLRPQPPTGNAPPASAIPSSRSSVADRLDALADQLADLAATLNRAIDRVDV